MTSNGRVRQTGSVDQWWCAADQLQTQPLRRFERPGLTARVMNAPSSESIQAGVPSQDHFALTERRDRVTFAVTDGVSASFFGEIAAKELSTRVADYLTGVALTNEDTLKAALGEFLTTCAAEVQTQVATFVIPEHVTGFVRQELERRREYGSEAMLACGIAERSEPAWRLAVAWLGDAHLRIWSTDGAVLDLEGSVDDRWSTTRGPRGDLGVWMAPAARVRRVLACTDGVSFALDETVSLSDDVLRRRLQALADAADSDDMALVDLGFWPGTLPPETAGGAVSPRTVGSPGQFKLGWRLQRSVSRLSRRFGLGGFGRSR